MPTMDQQRLDLRNATEAAPYCFVESGLDNVFLVGVQYRVDGDQQSADIPSVDDLLKEIARVIVTQADALTGEELRFVRKSMGLPAKRLAEALDVLDTTFSKYENGHMPFPLALSKLVRLIYVIVSSDAQLTGQATRISLAGKEKRWEASVDHRKRIIATLDAQSHWQVRAA